MVRWSALLTHSKKALDVNPRLGCGPSRWKNLLSHLPPAGQFGCTVYLNLKYIVSTVLLNSLK